MSSSRAPISDWLQTLAGPASARLRVMQGEAGALAAAELEPAGDRRLVDGQGHGRREDQHVGAPDRGHSTVDSVEHGMDQPVFGPRDVLQGQFDLALDARRSAATGHAAHPCRARGPGCRRPWPGRR